MKSKTHKAAAKRFKLTGSKKIIHRRTHQDHFNARERAVKTRSKRKPKRASHSEQRKIRRLLPYSA